MLDKGYLHHLWTRIRVVKTWYIFAAFLVFAAIAVVALRNNYTGMTVLRDAVYQADKDGGDVETTLQELRAYVASHMNTSLDAGGGVYPPLQLKYTYERLVKAEKDRVESATSQIYTEAQKHCEALHPGSFSGGPRVPCIQEYVKSHGTTAKSVPDALYKFDFVSPRWSPDLAGWSLVISLVLFVLTLTRFVLGRWLKTVTK